MITIPVTDVLRRVLRYGMGMSLLATLGACAVYEQPYAYGSAAGYQPVYGGQPVVVQPGYVAGSEGYYAPGAYYAPAPVYGPAPLWFNFNYRSGGGRPDHWRGPRGSGGPREGWRGQRGAGDGPRASGPRGGRPDGPRSNGGGRGSRGNDR